MSKHGIRWFGATTNHGWANNKHPAAAIMETSRDRAYARLRKAFPLAQEYGVRVYVFELGTAKPDGVRILMTRRARDAN